MSEAAGALDSPVLTSEKSSKLMTILRGIGWTVVFVLMLATFTVFKLPEIRIKNYIQGQIQTYLAPQGIGFSAEAGKLNLLGIPSYSFRDVTLTPPAPANPIKVDRISVSPAVLSALRGRFGGTVTLEQGNGSLQISGTVKPAGSGAIIDLEFKAEKLDLGKLGVLPLTARIQGSAIVNGKGRLEGDLNVPASMGGDIKVDLSQLTIEQQTYMGFAIPKLTVSIGKVDLFMDKGKTSIRGLSLGKEGSADDIILKIDGDIVLGKQIESSTLNLKTRFSFSEKIKKAFFLIDTLLSKGKQADGSYQYAVAGPLLSPIPTPSIP